MFSGSDWLRAKLHDRQARNPRYSLRAFARQLECSSGALSDILAGKRTLPDSWAKKIPSRLKLSSEEADQFRAALRREKSRRTKGRFVVGQTVSESLDRLSDETFSLISDWYYYAILSLAETEGFQADPKWIAKRLGVTIETARAALVRLRRMRLIDTKGRPRSVTSTLGVPSEALRKFHKQGLVQTLTRMDEVPYEKHNLSSITMAIDPDKLEEAAQLIRSFRIKLCKFLESDRKKEVYRLSVQLMPLSR